MSKSTQHSSELGVRIASLTNGETNIDTALKNGNYVRVVYVFGNGKRFAIAKNTGSYSSTYKLYPTFEGMAIDPYF